MFVTLELDDGKTISVNPSFVVGIEDKGKDKVEITLSTGEKKIVKGEVDSVEQLLQGDGGMRPRPDGGRPRPAPRPDGGRIRPDRDRTPAPAPTPGPRPRPEPEGGESDVDIKTGRGRLLRNNAQQRRLQRIVRRREEQAKERGLDEARSRHKKKQKAKNSKKAKTRKRS